MTLGLSSFSSASRCFTWEFKKGKEKGAPIQCLKYFNASYSKHPWNSMEYLGYIFNKYYGEAWAIIIRTFFFLLESCSDFTRGPNSIGYEMWCITPKRCWLVLGIFLMPVYLQKENQQFTDPPNQNKHAEEKKKKKNKLSSF